MSFINKSVNYAQTVLLKTKYLAPLLDSYNTHLINSQKNTSITLSIDYHIVPNNNKKYYLFVTKKNIIENCNNNYNLLYFFPDKETCSHFSQSKLDTHQTYDFFVEIDNVFTDSYLFEGYMYKKNNKTYYLISDVLVRNDQIVTCDYALRYTLINEDFMHLKSTYNLNNHLSVGIHPMFHCDNENMISIFYNNFIFKEEICALENIAALTKTRYIKPKNPSFSNSKKRIIKGKYTDVYEVYDFDTGNYQGILYIKGIIESSFMKHLFATEQQELAIDCMYNETFNKWSPKIN
jgi:hypothetical protein